MTTNNTVTLSNGKYAFDLDEKTGLMVAAWRDSERWDAGFELRFTGCFMSALQRIIELETVLAPVVLRKTFVQAAAEYNTAQALSAVTDERIIERCEGSGMAYTEAYRDVLNRCRRVSEKISATIEQERALLSGADDAIGATIEQVRAPLSGADDARQVTDAREVLTDSVVETWLDRQGSDGGQGLHPIYTSAVRDGYRLARSTLTDFYATRDAAPTDAPADPIRALIAAPAVQLEQNCYAYFELAYTRHTGWMAWLCSNNRDDDPNRKVLAKGQGDSPEAACEAALAGAPNISKPPCLCSGLGSCERRTDGSCRRDAAPTDTQDAERYRWASDLSDNAETFHSVVLCHEGDQDKINERIDSYRAASEPNKGAEK